MASAAASLPACRTPTSGAPAVGPLLEVVLVQQAVLLALLAALFVESHRGRARGSTAPGVHLAADSSRTRRRPGRRSGDGRDRSGPASGADSGMFRATDWGPLSTRVERARMTQKRAFAGPSYAGGVGLEARRVDYDWRL